MLHLKRIPRKEGHTRFVPLRFQAALDVAVAGWLLLAIMAATTLSIGCGDTAEEKVCQETVDTLADAWEACGYDRETKHAELLAAFRQCDRVESIRDEEALRNVCFPALETLDCTALEEDDLPAPCLDQIRF